MDVRAGAGHLIAGSVEQAAGPGQRPGPSLARRLVASHTFFVVVLAVLAAIVATDLVDALGRRPAQIARRNSEGIAMVLVAWYWRLFGGERDLAGRGIQSRARHPAGQLVWFAAWTAGAVLLQGAALGWIGVDWSVRVVTLGEAAATVAIISAYVGLTRGTLPGPLHRVRGGIVPSVAARIALLVVVACGVVAVYALGSPPIPGVVDDIVRLNVELVAGVLLLGLTVDAVATPPTRAGLVLGWAATMLAVPVVVTAGAASWLPAGLEDWTSRATEAFLASGIVAVWFHNWHVVAPHART